MENRNEVVYEGFTGEAMNIMAMYLVRCQGFMFHHEDLTEKTIGGNEGTNIIDISTRCFREIWYTR